MTELIEREAPWRNLEQVKYRTFHWIDWYNRKRLMGSLGDIRPNELGQAHYARKNGQAIAAMTRTKQSPEEPGRFSRGDDD